MNNMLTCVFRKWTIHNQKYFLLRSAHRLAGRDNEVLQWMQGSVIITAILRSRHRAGEGGNYCSAAREGKYMFPFLGLNIYPPLRPADSCSDNSPNRPGKASHWAQVMLKTRLPLVVWVATHKHTSVQHPLFLSLRHTHPTSWSD